MGVICMMYC